MLMQSLFKQQFVDRINSWKIKARERNKELKSLKKRVSEISNSRDKWKKKADRFKKQLKIEQKKTIKRIKKEQQIK
ncbi:MAG: hypothetical protein KAS64_09260 [Spirochaetes bacterium]|nr:hypothetical protein [Spirochaetota bacterium]